MDSTLPTLADYAEVTTALVAAQETVEAITLRLFGTADSLDVADDGPTLHDVGALFALIDDLDVLTADLTTKRDELRALLRRINLARLEAISIAPHPPGGFREGAPGRLEPRDRGHQSSVGSAD
jgi:hypothetical protein